MKLSNLAKTWLFDVDGTIVKHNGHLNGGECLLHGVREFFSAIPCEDKVILLTARKKGEIRALRRFLRKNGVRFDEIISDLPNGERILINDKKPSGLKTAHAVNKARDSALKLRVEIDLNL